MTRTLYILWSSLFLLWGLAMLCAAVVPPERRELTGAALAAAVEVDGSLPEYSATLRISEHHGTPNHNPKRRAPRGKLSNSVPLRVASLLRHLAAEGELLRSQWCPRCREHLHSPEFTLQSQSVRLQI
jgi:hypothetical protein